MGIVDRFAVSYYYELAFVFDWPYEKIRTGMPKKLNRSNIVLSRLQTNANE